MPKFSDITFTMTDVIKGLGFIALVGSMWLDLKADKIKVNNKIDFLQYQVNELKQVCGILPKQLKLEDEQNNRNSNR